MLNTVALQSSSALCGLSGRVFLRAVGFMREEVDGAVLVKSCVLTGIHNHDSPWAAV